MKNIKCGVKNCTYTEEKYFKVPEEKRTDVNIAVNMVNDSKIKEIDRFILVTGDSDLTPAITMIKSEYPSKEIIVYVPAKNLIRGAAVELRSSADKHKTLPNQLIKFCQFPSLIKTDTGSIKKPMEW